MHCWLLLLLCAMLVFGFWFFLRFSSEEIRMKNLSNCHFIVLFGAHSLPIRSVKFGTFYNSLQFRAIASLKLHGPLFWLFGKSHENFNVRRRLFYWESLVLTSSSFLSCRSVEISGNFGWITFVSICLTFHCRDKFFFPI